MEFSAKWCSGSSWKSFASPTTGWAHDGSLYSNGRHNKSNGNVVAKVFDYISHPLGHSHACEHEMPPQRSAQMAIAHSVEYIVIQCTKCVFLLAFIVAHYLVRFSRLSLATIAMHSNAFASNRNKFSATAKWHKTCAAKNHRCCKHSHRTNASANILNYLRR